MASFAEKGVTIDRGHLPLGPGREFDAIRQLTRDLGAAGAGIGGDCAEVAIPVGETLCVSVDSTVENVHFRRSWLSAEEIGYRATAAALSDLAAAAARPIAALLSIGVPDALRQEFLPIGRGVGEALRAAGAVLVGGDTTRAGELTVTVTVLGSATVPLRRSGAKPGDWIYVTGRLGGPAAAVKAWLAGSKPTVADRARFAHPVPRLAEARWLAEQGATSAVDVSDGLAADIAHIAAASGVALRLDLRTIPRMPGVRGEEAAVGGEEYELAVTGPSIDTAAFEDLFGVALTRVGSVHAGAPDVAARLDEALVDLAPGHDHFSR
jgi:thiamine-monophosphate kinase